MAKHIIQILGTFLIFAAIINGINGQCTLSDFCCTSGNGNWAIPDGIPLFMATCYIEGSGIDETDCPTGWHYESNKCSKDLEHIYGGVKTKGFASVKSCSDSNSCSSVENVCGIPTVRSGLSVSARCNIAGQGKVNISSCPKGWSRPSNDRKCYECFKTIRGTGTDEGYNATRSEDTTTCNPTIIPDFSRICKNPSAYNGTKITGTGSPGGSCDSMFNDHYAFANIDWANAQASDFKELKYILNIHYGPDCCSDGKSVTWIDYSRSCKNPSAYTGNLNLNGEYHNTCDARYAGSTTFANIDWANVQATDFEEMELNEQMELNELAADCCSDGKSAVWVETSAATMTARVHCVFVLLTILGIICWF